MGRPSNSQTLVLWANGERVGHWTAGGGDDMELQYDPAWVASAVGRPISLSLPFNLANQPLRGPRVQHYFDNLLPDSNTIRTRIAARFRTGSTEPFDLLAAIGRDCVGALQLLPQGQEPSGVDQIDSVALSDSDIERHLIEVVQPDRFGAAADPDDDFRISLAGAQEKHAFLWRDGQWHKPRGATPTTHIFKLPLGLVGGRRADFTTSVDNEWLCLRILDAFGLKVAKADIRRFGDQRVLVVERFDRHYSQTSGRLLRLVQEDFCQATGTSPLVKYENEGGPGLQQIAAVLQQSLHAEADLRTLMVSQVLFWMLRAPDGHAKNFSIQLLAGGTGRFHLTPMYDVMSAYPVIGDGPNQWADQQIKLAMALFGRNRHYNAHTIGRRHFISTARRIGIAGDPEQLLDEIIDRTPAVIDAVQRQLPGDFSQRVADRILGGLLVASRRLASGHP